jgi:adenine phosphoribosyltransferase
VETEKTYTLSIAGIERKLPLVVLSPGFSIASFVMLGDTRLIEAAAEALSPRLPRDIELLVCPEAKAIPLAHALALRMGLDYAVLRKSEKSYMRDPLIERTKSITTAKEQFLVLDGNDREKLAGRRVCIIDDVVSTGGSLESAEKLLARVPCTVAARAAVLLEEGGHDGSGLIYLERLPVFRT